MTSRLRSWWKKISKPLDPAVLAVGGYLFNYSTSRNEQIATQQRDQTERYIASDNQREAALQSYIDKISELLLDRHLRESQPQVEVRSIARVRTLTTLPRLDEARKGSVIQFLYESQLIDKDSIYIDLGGADLSGAYLYGADLRGVVLSGAEMSRANLSRANLSEADLYGAGLSGADLSGADLRETNLSGADLSGADLSEARLSEANLTEANLSEADLRGANLRRASLVNTNLTEGNMSALFFASLFEANLRGADLSEADLSEAIINKHQLDQAKSLRNATMPDGSKHP